MPQLFNQISYNGITLQIVKTRDVTQTPVWSDDQMDYLYTEVTVSLTCIYNPQSTSYAPAGGGAVPGNLPQITNKAIRLQLMTPRGKLIFAYPVTIGGVPTTLDVVTSPNGNDHVDVNNGPLPLSCNVSKMDGLNTWHVEYSIKTWILECYNENRVILSNRYTQSISLDDNYYTTRRTSGEAYFASNILDNLDATADQFRNQIFPSIPTGFKRRIDDLTLVSRLNMIRWSVTDVEQAKDIGETGPDGNLSYITHIDGTYHLETAGSVNERGQADGSVGGMSFAMCSVQITGSKRASTFTLIQYAIAIIANQIGTIGVNGSIVKSIRIMKHIMQNFVNVTYVVMQKPVTTGFAGNINMQGLFTTNALRAVFPDGASGRNPSPPGDAGTRGSSRIVAFAAMLKTACASSSFPPLDESPDESSGIYEGNPPDLIVDDDTLIDETDKVYNPDAIDFPYTRYKTESHYKFKSGKKQLPVAAPPAAPAGGPPQGHTDDNGNWVPDGPLASASADIECEIVNLSVPMSTRIVDWTAERLGSAPEPPNPDMADDNFILMDSDLVAANVFECADGETLCYSMSGRYTYAAKRPVGAGSRIVFDVPPFLLLERGNDAEVVAVTEISADGTSGGYLGGVIDTDASA